MAKNDRRNSGLADLLGELRDDPAPSPAAPAAEVAEAPAVRAPAPRERASKATSSGQGKTGKRSDPNYTLRGVYIRNDLHLDVTDRLRREHEFPDLADLVEHLLQGWLKKGRKDK